MSIKIVVSNLKIKKNVLILLVLVALAFCINYYFTFPKGINNKISKYNSSNLNFSFNKPQGFSVEEQINSIILKRNNDLITINRVFGESNSENDYLTRLATLNKIKIRYLQDYNNFKVIELTYGQEIPKKIFYIKNIDDFTFVSIATSSKQLENDLKQIAASFMYTVDTTF